MDDQIYYAPGEEVQMRQSLDHKPVMVVVSADMVKLRSTDARKTLLGITCGWFDAEHHYLEHRFNSKDLEYVPKKD